MTRRKRIPYRQNLSTRKDNPTGSKWVRNNPTDHGFCDKYANLSSVIKLRMIDRLSVREEVV
ncbi:unnamed protein product [Prunus armeniaca]